MRSSKFFAVILFCAYAHASQGFFREGIIDPTSPLSILDPVKHPEIERVVQKLRFFGSLSSRPASNVYVHYQAIQNLLVWPTSPVTALSWMLFPISPLPMINPNNIRVSDPLGKITPEQLGNLMGVISRHISTSTEPQARLQELYQLFVKPNQVDEFVKNHNEKELKAYYRYALIDGVNKYVRRNMTPQDEELNLTESRQAECEASQHLLVIEAFKHSPSHLLEIPGSEILREPGETWFTEADLTAALQSKYGGFSYRKIEKLHIAAAVDMLWKSAQESPEQTLQLLSYYAWRKFSDQIFNVIIASGAVPPTQRAGLSRALVNKFTKADYQALVSRAQETKNIDGFMDALSESEKNLILYGSARFSTFLARDYGNVRLQHHDQVLAFANCAEQSLFNLTYLAQLEEQEMGIERNPRLLTEESPLRLFWQSITEEDLNTTDTRNRWTQAICRLSGVVYRKGNHERTPWDEDHATAHWAELNPGVLNQMRVLFHLLGKPEEAVALTYERSNEEIIEAAALRISQLLSELTAEETTDTEEENVFFRISPKSELKKLPGKKDWYGEFEVIWHGEPLATWRIEKDHSFLSITKKKNDVFALNKPFINPYAIGQLEIPEIIFWNASDEDKDAHTRDIQLFCKKLDSLSQDFDTFFAHANLNNGEFRRAFLNWLTQQDESFHQYAHQIMYGVADIDEGRDLRCMSKGSSSFNLNRQTQKLLSFNALFQHVNANYCDLEINSLGKIALNYRDHFSNAEITEEDTCLPENRHTFLCINIAATNCSGSLCLNMCATDAIRFLSEYSFPQLSNIYFDFDKDCQSEDVKEIARFLPAQLRELNLSSMNKDHLVDFICNISLPNLIIHISIDGIYRNNEYTGKQYNLASTQQEFAYQLLFPLAKSGKTFDPEIIQLRTDDDLEPVYESLRVVAAIHKPMPLMLEDGEV